MMVSKQVSSVCTMAVALLLAPAVFGEEPRQSDARKELKVGDPAPDFSLRGSDGKTYRLADFRGKKIVVIAWFPKAFTSGCTRECKTFRDQADAFQSLPVAFFTASVDTPEDNRRFAESLEVRYPILSDPDRKTALAYGVVDDPKGYAKRWTFIIGTDGRILHIDKAVKVETHARDVAAWITNWLKSSSKPSGS